MISETQQIPSVEDIIAKLWRHDCTHDQAVKWMAAHLRMAQNRGAQQARNRTVVLGAMNERSGEPKQS